MNFTKPIIGLMLASGVAACRPENMSVGPTAKKSEQTIVDKVKANILKAEVYTIGTLCLINAGGSPFAHASDTTSSSVHEKTPNEQSVPRL